MTLQYTSRTRKVGSKSNVERKATGIIAGKTNNNRKSNSNSLPASFTSTTSERELLARVVLAASICRYHHKLLNSKYSKSRISLGNQEVYLYELIVSTTRKICRKRPHSRGYMRVMWSYIVLRVCTSNGE